MWHPSQGSNGRNPSLRTPIPPVIVTTSQRNGIGSATAGTSASGLRIAPRGPYTIIDADTHHPIRANRVNDLSKAFEVGDDFTRRYPDRDYQVLDIHYHPVSRRG